MKIQLCLSGGGARGFAHLGIVQGLSELGFEIIRISGTSAGAIAGSFIAAGYAPEEILDIFIQKKLYRMVSGAFSRGLLKFDGVEKLVKQYLPENFQDLKIPLIINATDLLSGRTIYFEEGPLARVIMASASIPGIFKPVSMGDYLLSDGGVLNNLPVEPLLSHSYPVIGVHVNPVGKIVAPSSAWAVLERTFHLSVYSNTEVREHRCDVLIEPSALQGIKVFDYDRARDCYRTGYEEVMRRADELLEKYL